MNIPTIKDSRGKPSATLFLIFVPFILVTGKYALSLLAGLTIKHHIGDTWELTWIVPNMAGSDLLAAISPLLAAWWARENGEKKITLGNIGE